MAFDLGGPTMGVRYTGTNLVRADGDNGVVVHITGGSDDENGNVAPTVAKLPVDTAAGNATPRGTVVTVEEAGTTRAPSGYRGATIQIGGTSKAQKSSSTGRTAPAVGDIGRFVRPDTTATGLVGGVAVSAANAGGYGQVVGITGTTDEDFLIVDWDAKRFDLT